MFCGTITKPAGDAKTDAQMLAIKKALTLNLYIENQGASQGVSMYMNVDGVVHNSLFSANVNRSVTMWINEGDRVRGYMCANNAIDFNPLIMSVKLIQY